MDRRVQEKKSASLRMCETLLSFGFNIQYFGNCTVPQAYEISQSEMKFSNI